MSKGLMCVLAILVLSIAAIFGLMFWGTHHYGENNPVDGATVMVLSDGYALFHFKDLERVASVESRKVKEAMYRRGYRPAWEDELSLVFTLLSKDVWGVDMDWAPIVSLGESKFPTTIWGDGHISPHGSDYPISGSFYFLARKL